MLFEWTPRPPAEGTRRGRNAIRACLIFAAVAVACGVGYLIGVRLGQPAGPPIKPYHLTFRLFHRSATVNLTVSELGLWVIFSLTVLFIAALTFAIAAWGQARRTARVNRELNHQIAERERAREALRKANEELRQFAYVAAHDLQEPLRNIRTALGILNRRYGAALVSEANELIAESIEGAKRLHGMVKDLLGLATITEHLAAPADAVDSNRILREVVNTFRGEIAGRGAELICGELPALRVHENHLYQLFHHLIGNALKYSRPDVAPSIAIAAERRSSMWWFSVRDNGIGFDPVLGEEIFNIFRRLHDRHEYPGSGMGLAICSKIVSAYGGSIRAEGRPNEGAVFQFTLPCAEANRD
ncbi:MAG TPA: ATP-binding protein [Bryobacteraceae bacterium]|jgi:light-regulated signal transduction histidine kinase (bacteriophytochrome)|nr:ATP-binding protein [Bryobacteraceae bacterium]